MCDERERERDREREREREREKKNREGRQSYKEAGRQRQRGMYGMTAKVRAGRRGKVKEGIEEAIEEEAKEEGSRGE